MRIAVLLSGGVDSSVALKLLQREEGVELHAFYLKIWLEDELAHLGECPWEEDLRYARAVAALAGVELEAVPLQRTYHQRVVDEAIEELRAGRTPSPDVWCNERIKFGAFHEYLESRGEDFDAIASGHYARRIVGETEVELHKGLDPIKDQTYFLYRLDQRQLRRSCFPLGALQKDEVRRLAAELELPNRARPDSQGICFLGKIPYGEFVRSYLGEHPGEIRERTSGRRLGEHRGHWFYTIGQRRGLGLGGGPWYVVDKDPGENLIWVSRGEAPDDLDRFARDRFAVPEPHWIGTAPSPGDGFEIKLRHSPETFPARLMPRPEGGLDVELERADPGVAPGQSAVIYRGEHCLGGGLVALYG